MICVGSLAHDVFVMEDGNDVAYGYAGNDYFCGGAGNDTQFGGDGGGPGTSTGVNTYVVRDIPSVQVVQDFTPGNDIVRFEGSGFASFADLVAHSFQNGAYLVVQVDGDTAVWLNGASLATITSASFSIIG